MRGGHKNHSKRDLSILGGGDWLVHSGCNVRGKRQRAAVTAGYIHYLVGQEESMEISQDRVVLEGICPVGPSAGARGPSCRKKLHDAYH